MYRVIAAPTPDGVLATYLLSCILGEFLTEFPFSLREALSIFSSTVHGGLQPIVVNIPIHKKKDYDRSRGLLVSCGEHSSGVRDEPWAITGDRSASRLLYRRNRERLDASGPDIRNLIVALTEKGDTQDRFSAVMDIYGASGALLILQRRLSADRDAIRNYRTEMDNLMVRMEKKVICRDGQKRLYMTHRDLPPYLLRKIEAPVIMGGYLFRIHGDDGSYREMLKKGARVVSVDPDGTFTVKLRSSKANPREYFASVFREMLSIKEELRLEQERGLRT